MHDQNGLIVICRASVAQVGCTGDLLNKYEALATPQKHYVFYGLATAKKFAKIGGARTTNNMYGGL